MKYERLTWFELACSFCCHLDDSLHICLCNINICRNEKMDTPSEEEKKEVKERKSSLTELGSKIASLLISSKMSVKYLKQSIYLPFHQ